MADLLTLTFPDLTPDNWHNLLCRVKRSTLLQSYAYAKAIRITQKLETRWGLILINGEEAGIFQLHEASILFGIFHVLTLDRGPLWFEGFGKASHIELFSRELNTRYPKRFGRSRRFIPEVTENKKTRGVVVSGFEKKPLTQYQTIWLDLEDTSENLRKNLNRKWRNHLNKSEKQHIEIDVDPLGTHISWMIKRYIDDRLIKKYPGPNPKFLAHLLTFCAQEDSLLILRAKRKGEAIAGICILKHGVSATYQIGWANQEARKCNAMNLLLWEAITLLKKDKIISFDLGGLTEDNQGLTVFKEGLGGEKVTYIGHFA